VIGIGLTALAAQKVGVDKVVESIVRSDFTWVLVACALMALSLFFRAASWYWIVRAALPNRPVRRRDVTSATMIGVLMSATLPARLGEPARAMSLARRIGRMREAFPVLLGTLVSQTLLNLLALALLGVIIVSSTDLFHSGLKKLFATAVTLTSCTGFGISTADGLAYGVILQAVEIATAVALGLPALVRERPHLGRPAGCRRCRPPR
jgi:phosphatidylinositol alpha-mannosyltransferase